MTLLAETLTALRETADRWDDLAQTRLRGTPRPWRQSTIPEEARAEMDRRARQERAEADDRAPGYSAAPLHLDVLDLMAGILMAADLLHEQVAHTLGHPTLAHPASAYADPRPYLAYSLELLPEAWAQLGQHAHEEATRMRDTVLLTLGEMHDGQMLDAICPFCIGRTYRKPAGELTLRVRVIPDRRRAGHTEAVVVCENPDGCTPFSSECGLWVNGRPAWHQAEWEWLAQRLIATRAA
jgi:hypothetical protein